MSTVNDSINQTSYSGLCAGKLLDIDAQEILLISLEKDTLFPEHTSPNDTILLMLEGKIAFFINDDEHILKKHQVFNFQKNIVHWVKAIENSKFLIIR